MDIEKKLGFYKCVSQLVNSTNRVITEITERYNFVGDFLYQFVDAYGVSEKGDMGSIGKFVFNTPLTVWKKGKSIPIVALHKHKRWRIVTLELSDGTLAPVDEFEFQLLGDILSVVEKEIYDDIIKEKENED